MCLSSHVEYRAIEFCVSRALRYAIGEGSSTAAYLAVGSRQLATSLGAAAAALQEFVEDSSTHTPFHPTCRFASARGRGPAWRPCTPTDIQLLRHVLPLS